MRLGEQDARKLNARKRRRRRLASTLMFVLATVVVFGAVGVIYTWYVGQQEAAPLAELPDVSSSNTQPKAPAKPTKKTQIGIVVQAFSTPVKIGENASLSIRTLPGAPCSITFTLNDDNELSKDTGLIPKVADDYGLVGWTWKVLGNVRPGTWPVEVTCANGSKSVYSRSDLVVKRQ